MICTCAAERGTPAGADATSVTKLEAASLLPPAPSVFCYVTEIESFTFQRSMYVALKNSMYRSSNRKERLRYPIRRRCRQRATSSCVAQRPRRPRRRRQQRYPWVQEMTQLAA